LSSRRNPKWQRDELILALDLYFRCNPIHINASHAEVIKLSEILNSLPIHPQKPDAVRFRNPNGVYMKLCNFLRYDPNYHGVGLQRGGKLEEQIWNEYAHNQTYLQKIAKSIIETYSTLPTTYEEFDEDEEEFPEGKILYRQHRIRERNKQLVSKAKDMALRSGQLKCTVCGFDFFEMYGEIGKGFIECHHIIPVSEYKDNKTTKLTELALVCSNCHRMLHRRRPWLTIEELASIVKSNKHSREVEKYISINCNKVL